MLPHISRSLASGKGADTFHEHVEVDIHSFVPTVVNEDRHVDIQHINGIHYSLEVPLTSLTDRIRVPGVTS